MLHFKSKARRISGHAENVRKEHAHTAAWLALCPQVRRRRSFRYPQFSNISTFCSVCLGSRRETHRTRIVWLHSSTCMGSVRTHIHLVCFAPLPIGLLSECTYCLWLLFCSHLVTRGLSSQGGNMMTSSFSLSLSFFFPHLLFKRSTDSWQLGETMAKNLEGSGREITLGWFDYCFVHLDSCCGSFPSRSF